MVELSLTALGVLIFRLIAGGEGSLAEAAADMLGSIRGY